MRGDAALGELMHKPPFVPESQPAIDLLVELQRARQGMAVVVDEYGGADLHPKEREILPRMVQAMFDQWARRGSEGFVSREVWLKAGADGLLIEVHCDPDHALSDGAQSMFPAQFDRLMAELRIIAPAIGRTICVEAAPRPGWGT